MMKRKNDIIVLLIILFLGIFFQKSIINKFPAYVHSWTQSDRYALALGFVNNDLNFFKPETFTHLKNHNNPENWKFPSENTITPVEFPIHEYAIAIMMKASGSNSPVIFRTYILIYSFLGLFFLFKLSYLWSKDFFKSILITVFTATSPVFVYYQAGFIPTIPSLSNAIIGVYFYSKFLLYKRNKDFNLGILFLTLATLSRIMFAIPLIALSGVEVLYFLLKKSSLRKKILPLSLSASVIIGYFMYNNSLRDEHGGIFLNSIIPANGFQNVVEILTKVKNSWLTEYFSITHYIVFILFALVLTLLLVFKRKKVEREISIFLLFIGVTFIGCLMFSALMLKQFVDHDYYFLDTFFLPIVLTFIVLVSLVSFKIHNGLKIIAILVVSVPMIISANKSQNERRFVGHWDKTAATTENFQGSEEFLDSLGIAKDAKLLVLDSYTTNVPLILMNRKGYAVVMASRGNIKESMKWDFDYLILQNEFFLSTVYAAYPEIITKFERIADNGKISVYTMNEDMKNQSLYDFIGVDRESVVFNAKIDFESQPDEMWSNTESTSDVSYSGNKSSLLASSMTFGTTFKTKDLQVIKEKSRTLLVSAYVLIESQTDIEIVVSIIQSNEATFYKAINITPLLKEGKGWQKIEILFQLPQVTADDYEFAAFFLNSKSSEAYIDDFEINIY